MNTSNYTVAGMTCSHCVDSVTEEVGKISGVVNVNVDLATGGLQISSEGTIKDSSVKEAVEEAGYELARV